MRETKKQGTGTFYGVGVGPGPRGLFPVSAVEALLCCDIIFCPKADTKEYSFARQCLNGIDIPEEKFEEIPFHMDPNRDLLRGHYRQLADQIAEHLKQGKNVGCLTLGDSMTYSTYGYTIAALLEVLPQVEHHTFPGITSYAHLAATFNWPLGEGKERVLILPCPDEMENLRNDIDTHDVVVLMKIGKRLTDVLQVLDSMKIKEHCVFGRRMGLEDEILCNDLSRLPEEESLGYLSTMLIRKNPREKRHL
ncbi:MAG: precorrin-2 C(20)-methyltransferase [SAR324 cluster bacterium]|nr:precorrin-2 C(20)-methyltransferase [SAR324 cluster bacterium]